MFQFSVAFLHLFLTCDSIRLLLFNSMSTQGLCRFNTAFILCHLKIMWWCPIIDKKGSVFFSFLMQGCCEVLETLIFSSFVESHTWDKKLVQLTKGIGLILLEARCFYSSRYDDIPLAAVAPPLLTLALGLTDKGFLVEMYCDIFVFLRV